MGSAVSCKQCISLSVFFSGLWLKMLFWDQPKLWHKDNKVDQSKKWEGAWEEEQQCQPFCLWTSQKINGLWMALSLSQKKGQWHTVFLSILVPKYSYFVHVTHLTLLQQIIVIQVTLSGYAAIVLCSLSYVYAFYVYVSLFKIQI